MAAGGMLPGGRQVHFKNASGKFMPPGGMEQRAEIRARLADIPRLAALQGWSQQPLPGAAARSQQPREVEARYRPPTPVERYWGGSRGNKRTQDQIERITQLQERVMGYLRKAGGIDSKGRLSPERYVPNPAAAAAKELLKLKSVDGRLGSLRIDRTMENPARRDFHFNTMTRDQKTGKATLDEQDRLLQTFLRTLESTYGILKDD
jgi:hypothetical protein